MQSLRTSSCFSLFLITLLCSLAHAAERAQITEFEADAYQHKADVGDLVTLTCKATGDTSPLVSIEKTNYINDISSSYNLTGETYNSSTFTMTATCQDNGNYVCRAENTYYGHIQQATRGLTLRVRCLPASCSGTDDPTPCLVNIGGDAMCRPCIYAYPYPTDWDFFVQKETQSGWETPPNVRINTDYATNSVYVYSMIDSVNYGDLGNYRAVGRPPANSNYSDSYFYFQLVDRAATVTPVSDLVSATIPNSNLGTQRYGTSTNSYSDTDSDSDSQDLYLNTTTTVAIAMAGLHILTLTIVIVLCVYVCQIKNQLAKVNPLRA